MDAPETEHPGPADDAATRALVDRWVTAFNARDSEALVALTTGDIEFHPSVLVGTGRLYKGHDELRAWVGDVAATRFEHTAEPFAVRRTAAGDIVMSGEIIVGGEPASAFTMLFRLRDGKVCAAWSFLSDERTLLATGRIDPD
jgi:ketosteroid isomerase-like protein